MYKLGKLRNDGVGEHGAVMPHRDEAVVRQIIGTVRKAVQIGTAFFSWPIAQAYPTWHQFQQQIAEERVAAEKEGRLPHSAARPPGITPIERREQELGPAMPRNARPSKNRPPVRNSFKNNRPDKDKKLRNAFDEPLPPEKP